MSYLANSLASGAAWQIEGAGNFFRLLAATGAVRAEFYRNGSLISVTDNVQAGFWRESAQPFDRVRLTDQSGGANALEVVIDSDHIGYDRMSISGNISAQAKNGTPTQAAATVTTTSAQLVAANANRRYLLVQNKSTSGTIYLNFAGAAATTANGLKIGIGEAYESSAAWVSSAQINAIGDIASNPDVVVIEGN
jgi:hypothetical protein